MLCYCHYSSTSKHLASDKVQRNQTMSWPLRGKKSKSSTRAGQNAGKWTLICGAVNIVWSLILTTTKFGTNCAMKINILIVHILCVNTSIFLLMSLACCLELANIRISKKCIPNSASFNFVLENNFNNLWSGNTQ